MIGEFADSFVLQDGHGRQSARVDVRSTCGMTFLTLEAIANRATGHATADFSSDDLVTLMGVVKLALQASREFENSAMGVR